MLLFRTFVHRKIAILSVTRHILRLSHLKLLAVHRRIYGDLVCCTLLCVYSMLSAMRLDITYVLYLDIYIYTLLLKGIHTPDIHRRIRRVLLVCASHIKHYVQPLITFTNKLMPLIFQYNIIANTFGLILFVN